MSKLKKTVQKNKLEYQFNGPQLEFRDPIQPLDASENPSIDSPNQSIFSPQGDQKICLQDLQQQQQQQQKQQKLVQNQEQEQIKKKQKQKQKSKQNTQIIDERIVQYLNYIASLEHISVKKYYFEFWELFHLILLGFLIFYVPLQISFDIFNLKQSIIFVKFLEIIIRLFQKKQIYFLTKKFFYQYAKERLIKDSIFTCFTIFLAIDMLNWVSFLIVLVDWYQQMDKLVQSTQINVQKFKYMEQFKFDCFVDKYGAIRLLFLVNLIVCLYTDLLRPEFEDKSFTTEYVECLYQVLRIITFNWQPIPKTQLDQLYCVLLMTLGLFTFLFIMRTTLNYKFDDSDQLLLDECKKYKLHRKMVEQVMLHKKQNNGALLQNLLQQYKNEQKQQNYIKLFQTYFKEYKQENLKNLLIEEEEYLPNQTIIKQDKLDDCSLYYIVSGLVKVSINDFHTIGYLSENQNFGDIAFFTGQGRIATVTSVEYTKILKVSLNQFLKQLDSDDLQKYHYIRSQFINNQQYFNKCFCCQKITHVCQQCPLLNYIPNPKQFLIEYAQSLQVKQQRQQYYREIHKQRKYKSLKVLDRVRVCQVKFNFLNNQMSSNSSQSQKNKVKSQDFISNIEVSPILQRSSLLQNVRVKDEQQQRSEQYLQQLMISQTGIQRISQTNIGVDQFYQTTNLQKRMKGQDKNYKSNIQFLEDPLSPIIESLKSLESDNLVDSQDSDYTDSPFNNDIDQLRDFNIYYPEYNHKIIVNQVNRLMDEQRQ